MIMKIFDYLKKKWLFLLIVLALIIGNVWIWCKALTPTNETWSFFQENAELIFSAMLAVTSIVIAVFAWQQHKLEKTRLKLEAYDKRFYVYQEIKKFINSVKDKTILDMDRGDLDRIKTTISLSNYIFDKHDDIISFVDGFLNKGLTLIKSAVKKGYFRNISGEKNDEMVKKEKEIMDWFEEQEKVIKQKFEKYLRIE